MAHDRQGDPRNREWNIRLWDDRPKENLATRVANGIREQIIAGRLLHGSQLPAEIDLAHELGVSRQTLREATRLLTLEGLLSIRHGVGTFVQEPKQHLSSPLDTMHSMSALIREHGGESRVNLLQFRRIQANEEVAKRLDIEVGSPVAEISRRRLIGKKPLAMAYDYLSLAGEPESKWALIKTFDGSSIYRFLETKFQLEMAYSEATVSALPASKKHAEVLNVKPGFPLLLICEVQFEASRKRCLYSTIYHNSALVEFTLMRPGIKRESI